MNTRQKKISTLVVAAVVATMMVPSAALAGALLYVDDDAPLAGDGLGWVTAYRFLQDALADAAGGGITEIRVAGSAVMPATYTPDQDEAGNVTPGDRQATFQLINGVALRGGYRGAYDGTGMPADDRDIDVFVTKLSGDLLGNDVGFVNNAENSYHLVTGSGTIATAVLDGFTITAGNANGLDPDNRGGGMLNLTGSPTVTGCRFIANSAGAGGGMHNRFLSNPTISDCTFSGNVAAGPSGAGMGGGMGNNNSSPIITNCTFSDNMVMLDAGGGLGNVNGSSPIITNCTFSNNTSALVGGGMFNSNSNPTVSNCTFSENSADNHGGGIFNGASSSPLITNSLFVGNAAVGHGGAIMNTGGSSLTITNSTSIGNTAGAPGGGLCGAGLGSNALVANCVIYGNDAPSDPQLVDVNNASTTVSYCNVQGGWAGEGSNNIDADPLFVDADGPDDDPLTFEDNDYRLAAGSPSIDSGDSTAVGVGITTDLDGNPRFVDDPNTIDTGNGVCHVDMGAYEFQLGAVVCCPGDIDGNGVINVLDLIDLLLCFGLPAVPGCEAEDVNGDGTVNVLDLIQLLLAFGTACP